MASFNLSRRQLIAAAAIGLTSGAAFPQSSKRLVKFVLPNAVGSGVDTLARAVQPAFGQALGANVIVDNQPGAGGIIGLQALARSEPDGSTLSIVSNNVVIFPSVLKSIPFKVPGDFTPIAMIGSTPLVLVVNPKVAATNSKELVELLKSQPGKVNYGSSGNGSVLHLACEMFLDEAKVTASHIPYKGVGPMLNDLLGGQVEFAVAALPSVQAHITGGTVRAIGMATAERVPMASNIPTFVEQGLPGYVMEAWFAVLGPKGMSAANIERVHAAVVATFNDPHVKDVMEKQGNTINVKSSEEAVATFKSELVKYERLVKKAGVEPT
jgi:tripartite-type tricarboxylate transporter receptor subunit TctC